MTDLPPFLPTLLAILAAVVAAVAVDLLARRRGEEAPGFHAPAPLAPWRRLLALVLLAGVFYAGVFLPFALPQTDEAPDLSAVAPWQLFTLHALLGATLLAWGLLAFAVPGRRRDEATAVPAALPDAALADDGPSDAHAPDVESTEAPIGASADAVGANPGDPLSAREAHPAGDTLPPPAPRPSVATRMLRAFRLADDHPWREIGLGLGAGVAIWAAVLFAVAALAALLYAVGWDEGLPQGAPPLVAFIAGQPFWLRLLASLSAGFFEETFFRGFLQARVGIPLSTLLFVLAHWSYGEPFMLVGVTLLSLTYAALARWRRSVWAAVAAHAVFDGVQLLVLVPLALKTVEAGVPLPGLIAALGPLLAGALGAPSLW